MFSRTFDDIYSTIVQDLVENTPITNMSGSSTARALAESVASVIANLYADMDTYSRANFLSTAVGEDLDKLGELFGVTRGSATRAYSGDNNFQFFIDPRYGYTVSDLLKIANDSGAGIGSVVIRKGTVVSTPDGGVVYTTISDATLTNTGTHVGVIAAGVGAGCNVGIGALTAHNIASNQPELSPIARFIACSNTEEPIDTAEDFESDSNYRSRIAAARLTMSSANRSAIEAAAMSVPGVAAVTVNSGSEGPGTFEVVITTTYAVPSQAVLRAAHEAISQVAAYGTRATVTTPELLAIELKLRLIFMPDATQEDKDNIMGSVRRAVIDYTNNLPIGGEWIANEVVQRAMEQSDYIKDMKQEYFRISTYQKPMTILGSGKSQARSAVDVFKNIEGSMVVWGNHSCKLVNPPQKFLMLGRHLIVC